MTPHSYSQNQTRAYFVSADGNLSAVQTASYYNGAIVRPTISLKHNITISEGIGTQTNPYVIN